MEIKYTVVIPTYNRAWCIMDAIQSVISEKLRTDIEVLVVDDGSTDETFSVVSAIEKQDARVKYLTYGNENRGVCVARNYGVERARGKWVVFCDSDDKLYHNAFEILDGYIAQNASMVAFGLGGTDQTKACTVKVKDHRYVLKEWREYFDQVVDGEFTFCVLKDILLEFPLYEELNGFEGIRWYNMTKKYWAQIMFADDIITYKNVTNADSILRAPYTVKKAKRELVGNLKRLEICGEDLKKYNVKGKDGLVQLYATLGKLEIYLGNIKEGLKYSMRAFCKNPLELRVWRNILMIIMQKRAQKDE